MVTNRHTVKVIDTQPQYNSGYRRGYQAQSGGEQYPSYGGGYGDYQPPPPPKYDSPPPPKYGQGHQVQYGGGKLNSFFVVECGEKIFYKRELM